jgi:hypothetical protein
MMGTDPDILLPSMDPTRTPVGTLLPPPAGTNTLPDPTIKYVDLSNLPAPAISVPYNASYNATLYKQLSPAMKAYMQALFP